MDEVNDNMPLGRLTIRQRRQMGLTFVGVLRAGRELARRGEITKDTDRETVRVLIAEELALTNAKAWSTNVGEIDWDAVFAFIEKLIELIMRLFVLM